MTSFDDSEGVWRTIGGRKVFIRDGESVSSAMKRSGKFKSAKKGEVDNYEKEQYKHNKKMLEKPENKKILEELDKDKLNNDKEKTSRDSSGKEITKEELKQIAKSSEGTVKEMRQGDVRHQTEDIEKASGLKVEKSWQTDKFGNGDADRFELSDGRIIEHSRELLGKKEDKWSVQTVEKGTINSKSYDSYDDMIKDLGGSNNDNKSIKQLNKEMLGDRYKGKGQTPSLIYSNDRRIDIDSQGHATVWKDGKIERKTNLPENVKGDKTKDYFDYYLKKLDNDSNQSNAPYKKAFQEYMKKHPNSKLTLQKFIDMSEGK